MIHVRKMILGWLMIGGMFTGIVSAEPVDQLVHQVKLRCEGQFRSAGRFLRTADTQPSNAVRKMSSDICVHEDLEITVARTEYMPETKMVLKDLVKQSAAALGRRSGVSHPMQSMASVKVSTLPAERLSFSARLNQKPMTVESLYFMKEQTLWTVQIVFATDDETRKKAERILESVRLQMTP